MNDAVSQFASGSGDKTSLVRRADFALGDATVRPSLRKLEGPLGGVTGEPRVMQVLVALADARGAVLSREDLLQLCWEGRIVGDDAINRAISEVRRIAAAVGASFEIETVPRIGYRLAGIEWDEQPSAETTSSPVSATDRRKLMVGGAVALALLAGGGAAIFHRQRDAEVDALIERGRVLQGSGGSDNDRQAANMFRDAIELDAGRADAWGWLAVVSKEYDDAREAALRALELDPKEPNARAVLAFQRRGLEAWTQWEDTLLGVLHDTPDNTYALNQLTFFYQGMGRCLDSWNTNERAIQIEPFNPSPLHRRALKNWIFGRVSEADKVVDQGLHLWPRDPSMWNSRMLIYACTGRPEAAFALLDDTESRPAQLTPPSIASWRSALAAITSRSARDIALAEELCTRTARLAPGLAANAIMLLSYLGSLDAAYTIAEGLFEGRGPVVQVSRGNGIRDIYSASAWGRTQFLFIPATASFRADFRFPELCRRMGHVAYWQKRGIWPDPFVRGSLDPAKIV